MADKPSRPMEPNSGYIGEGVTFKGSISAPDLIIVDGTVEGDVTARSVKVGATGAIRGSLVSTDADVEGKLSDNVEVKGFLHVRSTGQVEGNVTCGDVQIEKGAILAATMTSTGVDEEEQLATTEIAPPVARIKLAAAE